MQLLLLEGEQTRLIDLQNTTNKQVSSLPDEQVRQEQASLQMYLSQPDGASLVQVLLDQLCREGARSCLRARVAAKRYPLQYHYNYVRHPAQQEWSELDLWFLELSVPVAVAELPSAAA